jgi:sec-independent protein translocase protein TatA
MPVGGLGSAPSRGGAPFSWPVGGIICFVPLSPLEIALIALIIVLVFSSKRIPELGRYLGTGIREFKDAITGSDEDEQEQVEASERIDLSSTAAPQSEAAEAPPPKTERVSS